VFDSPICDHSRCHDADQPIVFEVDGPQSPAHQKCRGGAKCIGKERRPGGANHSVGTD
jgi:hypothetical protein